MKRKSNDKRLAIARYMPPLKRRPSPESPYVFEDDQVLQWMAQQQKLMMFFFDKLVANDCIKYDPNTKEWVGTEYDR